MSNELIRKLKPEIVKGMAFDIKKESSPGEKSLYHFDAKTWPIGGHIWAPNKEKAIERFEKQMLDPDLLKKKAEKLAEVT